MQLLYTTIFILITIGFLLTSACGNQNNKSVQTAHNQEVTKKMKKETPPEQLQKAKEILQTVSEAAITSIDAKAKYRVFCIACHGPKGDLNFNNATDLTQSTIGLEESIAQIYHGKGMMTPFKGIMKDKEIVAVAKYIEKLRK